jgi:hypothetical protein
MPFAIKNLLNGARCFGRRPARRAGRRPHKIPPIRIQKLFASSLNGVEVLEAIGALLEVG